MHTVIRLSLISHTNVGKTTLARTLLRRDVGEVLDQAHVTDASESYSLIQTEDARLELWDTPGFGDTARLVARLRRERDPLGWFLHQVWDRLLDRPLWCSQEAVRNIKNHADVVLYLVNASEEPAEAGYVSLELELLTWIGRPTLLLLNQVGAGDDSLHERWRDHVKDWPVVRGVLPLDAFTRCWTEESILLERVVDLLEGRGRAAMRQLATAWSERGLTVFRSSCASMARYVVQTATDREVADPSSDDTPKGAVQALADALKFSVVDKKQAMAALNRRLDRRTNDLMQELIEAHGLAGSSAASIEQRIHDFQIQGGSAFDERSGALAGAVVSGALGGLAADALSGGLTLGGGLIAGGILGALGGSALARGYRLVGGAVEPCVRWTPEFLERLSRQVLLRYLAVAHFGRGRGSFQDSEEPAHWSEAVEAALGRYRSDLQRIWSAADKDGPSASASSCDALAATFETVARQLLGDAYPHAARILGR